MANRYQNGKIYKIVDIGYNKCYIGSTIEALSKRMSKHRDFHKLFHRGKTLYFQSSIKLFDKYGIENCNIEQIEKFPCNSREELTAREGYHIRDNECVNKVVVGRTPKEWYRDNQEKVNEKLKLYCENSKDKIQSYQNKYREDNKVQIQAYQAEYRQENNDKINIQKKEFREQNSELIKEKDKQWREKNKEQIKERMSIKYVCDCGSKFNQYTKVRHFRTMKHMEYLESLN
jgi:hypothetical protein